MEPSVLACVALRLVESSPAATTVMTSSTTVSAAAPATVLRARSIVSRSVVDRRLIVGGARVSSTLVHGSGLTVATSTPGCLRGNVDRRRCLVVGARVPSTVGGNRYHVAATHHRDAALSPAEHDKTHEQFEGLGHERLLCCQTSAADYRKHITFLVFCQEGSHQKSPRIRYGLGLFDYVSSLN